ncbi:MAG: FAD-binding oxidoreductase [Rhodobacteraceae bacterium]|jgi:glycine/D-amino acid oxidase-like deaminating enzyme|nr:FAD-binding oxidoreductase [Alphaproteobacteria bacterium]MBT8477123.1 FAD-binding oxidoreductase [Alphaproteobacteria bacterium]NNK66179.1 FAD-binding oxidoreductase [Paracoccaceae bacterium]
MTKRHDVAIVGGGLVGLFSALYLARQGASVVVFEAGDPGAEASGANAGSLHLQIQYPEFVKFGENWARAYAPTLRFLAGSIELWKGMSDDLGEDLAVSTKGGIVVAKTDAQMRAIESKSRIEAEFGVETRVLGQSDLQRLAPYLSKKMIGGGFCADEGKADTLRATPALLNAVRTAGVDIHTHTPVKDITVESGGFHLATTNGAFRATQVVNAAGAKAAQIASMVGVSVGLEGFPLQVTVGEPCAPIIPHLIYSAAGKLTLKQAPNGGLIVGGGWAAQVREGGGLATNPVNFAANMALAAEVVPAVASARTVRSWTAWVNGTADWRPVIGEAQGVPGFYLALFPWVGFSAAPMTGRVVADLVAARDLTVPLKGISVLYD